MSTTEAGDGELLGVGQAQPDADLLLGGSDFPGRVLVVQPRTIICCIAGFAPTIAWEVPVVAVLWLLVIVPKTTEYGRPPGTKVDW